MTGRLLPCNPLHPPEGQVHVWAVALDQSQFDRSSGLDLLSPEEKARAQRFRFAGDQRRYIVAHTALRDILAGYLHMAAADLPFAEGVNGKPCLTFGLATTGIEFNLSHSHELALVAVARELAVGIDLEFVKHDFVFYEIAQRFFTTGEVDALQALPAELRRRAFFKCWTSKEAFLKAKGTGLSGSLDEVAILCDSHKHVTIRAAVPGWSLVELKPIDDYESALVVKGDQPVAVQYHVWTPARDVSKTSR